MFDDGAHGNPVPDIPGIYTRQGRSTSFLVERGPYRQSYVEKEGSFIDSPHAPSKEETPEPKQEEPLKISGLHEFLFVGVVIMAQFMALAGLGQAIAPVQIIADGLGVRNPGEEAWFAAAYSLTVGTFILISGRMGDILGHKRMFIFGYFFLGVWSGFAGFSAYVGRQVFFDVCRAFQGIGAAMLAPNALALLGRAYAPGVKKNIVFSLFGAMAPWGFVIGALFGSIFAQLTWWPWLFWSYACAAWGLAAFAAIVVPKALAYEAQFAGRSEKPGMDWTGSILGVSGLVLVNVAWNNGPLYGWGEPHVYFVLIIGILTLIAFVWVEARAVSPLLPVRQMSSTVTYTMALIGIGWGSFGIWIYYCWRFLLEVRNETPLQVSAQYTPALVCGLLAAGATGYFLTHTPVAFVMMVSMIAFLAGELIAAFQPVRQTYWAQMFVSILIMRKPLPSPASLPKPQLTSLSFRHGHVIPRRHDNPLQPHAQRAPRPRRLARQHNGQLQHLHRPRNRRHSGSTSQQSWSHARGHNVGDSVRVVDCVRTQWLRCGARCSFLWAGVCEGGVEDYGTLDGAELVGDLVLAFQALALFCWRGYLGACDSSWRMTLMIT